MGKNNVGLKFLVIILSLLVVGLGGFIVYDKVVSNDEVEDNNGNSNSNNADGLYSYNDFSETVFSDDGGNNYLILWKNGTYSYNDTIGNYIIENSNIVLNSIFNKGKFVSEENQIKLEILSITELKDLKSNVKLNKVNQPTSPGGTDFYYNINLYKYEDVGLRKLISGYWWKKGTDKLMNFYQSHFSIGRDGKGCGPDNGCGSGVVNSIVKKENNVYDINFAYEGNDGPNVYLATIDISNIENNKITLVGFYQVKDNNKKSLIDGKEEYVFAGYTRHEYAAYAFSN